MPGLNLKNTEASSVLVKVSSCSQGVLQPKTAAMLISVQNTPAAHPPPATHDNSPPLPVKHSEMPEKRLKLFLETAQGTQCI